MPKKPAVPARRYLARSAVLGVLATTVLAGCSVGGSNFGSPPGITEQSKSILHDWRGTFVASMILGGIVLGLVLWCILRYRRKPGQTELPRQFQYHIPLEVTYTAIPIVIAAVVFGFMYNYENKVDKVVSHPAVEVRVDAFQWGWKFTYKKNGYQIAGNINDFPTLVLPTDETVQLDLYSDDVNHSFYVPAFLFKRDMIQGVHNVVDFTIDKTGSYPGQCTQLCGVFHSLMKFYIHVVPPGEFNTWLNSQATTAMAAPTTAQGA